MKTDIIIHMFPARHMVRAVRLAVLSLLFWIGLMPASAQIYSTAQGGTQYKGTYEEAYGSMNNGYYGSMEAQYEYNPYQSNVYKPGSSTPNTGLRKHHLSVHTPWSDSYAPMRTKKNSPTGGAIGEDNKSENDPEGETGAPDGFITPSDPGHQSNQSPVGEAWILLLFAAAAAWVVFRRQQREKKHIAIYSEVQQPSDKSNMKQHIRKSLFISIILLAGVSNAWAEGVVYFQPTSDWKKDNARFAAYFFKEGGANTWASMSQSSTNGVYKCDIPNGDYDKIIFCRMNPQNTTNNWDNKWNQSANIALQINQLCTQNTGVWDSWSGSWSTVQWYIAGDFTNWNNNKKLMPCDITLTIGEHELKVVSQYDDWFSQNSTMTRANSSRWDMQKSINNNCKLTADIAGSYNFSFDGTKLSVTYPEECFLTGSFNNWDNTHSILSGSVTIQLRAGTHTFKIHRYDNNKADYWCGNSGTMTRENCSGWTMYSDESQDCKIEADFDGEYTFTYNRSTGLLSVTYPAAYTITYGTHSGVGTIGAKVNGTAINSGTLHLSNTQIQFTATPGTEHTFTKWVNESGAQLSTNNPYTHTLTADQTVKAVFTINKYALTFGAREGGSVIATANSTTLSSPAKLDYNTTVTLKATANPGYEFINWIDEKGTELSTSATYSHTIKKDQTAIATFRIKSYTINFSAQPGGSVSANVNETAIASGSSHNHGTQITFTATTDNNYEFIGWKIGSNIVSTATTYTHTLTSNTTIQATFSKLQTVYFQAVDWWKNDAPRFAAYAYNSADDSKNKWYDLEAVGCSGEYFTTTILAIYDKVIFCRMNPETPENSFTDGIRWNQTPNLTVPTDSKNLFTYPRIYLKPNSNWTTDNARFAARFYQSSGSNEEWKDMTDADGDGYYSCETPNGYDMVIFCRMNPSTTENNWDNKWNQTVDLSIQEAHIGSANCFTLYDDSWNNGSWSTLWTTYSAPEYSVTLNATNNGTTTATYNSTTTSSKNNGTATLTNIPLNQNVTFTFEPAEGYQFANAKITIGNQELEVYTSTFTYPICGPATVSAHFVATETRKIYLRPNDEWMKYSPVFATYAFKEGSDVHQWYIMNTEDTDYTGAYSCDISTTYDHVHFVRINPKGSNTHNQGINWANAWNQTIALEIVNDIYNTQNKKRFEIIAKNTDSNKGDLNHYDGAWEENTPIWGITSDFNNWHAEDAVFMGYPGKLNILLSAASHEFKLYNFRHGHYYGNTGTYQRTNSGQWWTMDLHNDEGNNCTVVADIDNEAYLFQLQLITELGTYKKQISITYPDFTGGAYRLAYKDNTPGSFHPAHYIKYNASEEVHLDTISFFIHHDKEPEIWLQQCTDDIYTQNPTWETIAIYPATSSFPTSDNPGNAMLPGKKQSDATIHIGEGCGITSSGVYNFILQQTNTGEHTAELDTRATHLYEGNYYIRTDYAEGGWTNYLEPANLMTYSSYADHYEPFSYYFCEWITSPRTKGGSDYSNIAYTIANPYSRCISDTLIGDNIIAKDGVTAGCLPDSANVRFTWNHETNALARAYLKGSGQASDRFLVLTGKDNNLKDANGNDILKGTDNRTGLLANEEMLSDAGNWIYTVDVTANREAAIKLTAKYNDKTQYFKGSESEYTNLLSSTAHDSYKIRIIYDFKINQLITAWLPDNSKTYEDEALGTNMMIIRTNHEQATQINFNENKSLSDVGIGYAVMTFTEGHVTGSGTVHDRSLYWVSFPFDVWLRDVTGFGEYGTHWIMEYYDGESRAQNGLWADSDTYWKYITNPNYKLEAGKGYVLCLNLGKMATAFTYTKEVSLYFPSVSPLDVISSEVTAAEVPAHTCTIERDNRKIYDSNWNLIGAPGFKDITNVGVGGSAHEKADPNVSAKCVSFYYAYQSSDNSYIATAETNDFQIMHSYMVQFAGTIEWSSLANPPASVAARRTGEMPSEHTLRLELAQGEDKADQTIIKLQEQDATTDFDMNIDMAKIKNSGANIYTLTENTAIMVAGNALPMEKVNIPVGIEVTESGTYTLRMPDGTDGISVTLLDNLTGIHTDMLLGEYTVTLDAGSHLNRFYIAVDPDRTATSVENVGEEAKGDKAKGMEKFLIDGQLFIRTAEGIFDAKGQRL